MQIGSWLGSQGVADSFYQVENPIEEVYVLSQVVLKFSTIVLKMSTRCLIGVGEVKAPVKSRDAAAVGTCPSERCCKFYNTLLYPHIPVRQEKCSLTPSHFPNVRCTNLPVNVVKPVAKAPGL